MRLAIPLPIAAALIASVVALLLWYALGIVVTSVVDTAISVFSGG